MDELDLLRGFVRRMQIIAGALIAGVLAFLIVATLVVHAGGGPLQAPAGNLPLITLILVGLSLVQIPTAVVFPGLMIQAAVQQLKSGQKSNLSPMAAMLRALNSVMIMRMAMLEGGAFAATIAYMLEGSHFAWPGILAPVTLMLWYFPTTNGCREKLEEIAGQLKREP